MIIILLFSKNNIIYNNKKQNEVNMPVYEYTCTKCNENFEIEHSIKETNKQHLCKECSALLKRKISKTSFVLKGSGWYRDGYSKK